MATGQFDTGDLIMPDLRVGEIRVVRTFRVSANGDLIPLTVGGPAWTDGANTARCRERHTPPVRHCQCGFYGLVLGMALRALAGALLDRAR